MESLKNVYCEKMGLFRFFGGKNFFCGGACGWTRWTAARRGIGLRGLLRGVPGACGWTFLGERGWRRWRLRMFNLIYHLLLENHKWSRCSSGRVSVDSAAFFGYKFGYKILNSRKPSGSAGAKQLTNNLRMDGFEAPLADGRSGRAFQGVFGRGWMFLGVRSWRRSGAHVRLECRRVLAAIWARCFPSGLPPYPGGGASGKFTGGIAIQYIFARKNFGILANDNKRIKTNRAIGRISHIVVRWLRQGTVFTAPLIFSRG